MKPDVRLFAHYPETGFEDIRERLAGGSLSSRSINESCSSLPSSLRSAAASTYTIECGRLPSRYFHQARTRRVIDVLGDTPVLYPLDHLIHNK